MYVRGCASITAVAVCCLLAGCGRAPGKREVITPPWPVGGGLRTTALSPLARTVRVVNAVAPTCQRIGYVTGVAARRAPRRAGLTRSQFEAFLPRVEAMNDARNLAARGGGNAFVIDAVQLFEKDLAGYASNGVHEVHGGDRSIAIFIHGRALRCRDADTPPP